MAETPLSGDPPSIPSHGLPVWVWILVSVTLVGTIALYRTAALHRADQWRLYRQREAKADKFGPALVEADFTPVVDLWSRHYRVCRRG